ncbi:MAG: PQQ-dependent dehydrogenase, methanol/ethanol family [Alphaproteobacteria bacterium]|nr:PQQ-dependent dehydrogenase, methanol/ethanol family [Alphaproteobacteria bacterium]
MRQAGSWAIRLSAGLIGLGLYAGVAQAAQTAGVSDEIGFAPVPSHFPATQPVGPEAGVTGDMLKAGTSDPARWLMYGGDYKGYRHSPIKSLDPAAAKKLKVAWSFPTGTTGQFEASPVIYGGVMYVTSSYNRVFALNAQTGELLWRYDYPLPEGLRVCCGPANRGVAISGDLVLMGTLDAHLVALDRRTGNVKWNIEIVPYKDGFASTSAPLIVGDKAITGIAGGEYGIRGFFDAYDIATGKRLWRHYTVPAAGEPGAESWTGDSAETGGAPTWTTGVYDMETDTLFWTTGNPSPDWNGDDRAGDNLYSNSIIAVDPATGVRKWHYQFTPHDVWDFDGNSHIFLVDVEIDGKPVKAIAQPNRNGFFYLLDRSTGKFLFAKQYVEQLNWAKGFDEKGRPIVDPAAKPMETPDMRVCPGNLGGLNGAWTAAYSPLTKLAYVPSVEACQRYAKGIAVKMKGLPLLGGMPEALDVNEGKAYGILSAIDVATGAIKWRYKDADPMMGGAMTTAGGVVFSSTLDGHALALDAGTGAELWRFRMGGAGRGQPVAYEAGGKAFVAIPSGGWATITGLSGGPLNIPDGGHLFVFTADE